MIHRGDVRRAMTRHDSQRVTVLRHVPERPDLWEVEDTVTGAVHVARIVPVLVIVGTYNGNMCTLPKKGALLDVEA